MGNTQVIQSGAGVRVSINGSVVGFATSLSFTRTTSTKVIYGIDSPVPAEIAPTVYSVQGNLSGFRLRDSGGLDGTGIMNVSSVYAFFAQKYCTIEVVDILTNVTMYQFNKVIFDQDSWNISTKQLVTFSASFKAVFVQNEVTSSSQAPASGAIPTGTPIPVVGGGGGGFPVG
jgi:hypothetical protein